MESAVKIGQMVRAVARPELVLTVVSLPSEADWRLGVAYADPEIAPIYVDPREYEAVPATKRTKADDS